MEAAVTPEEEPQSSEPSSSFPIAGHSHTKIVEKNIDGWWLKIEKVYVKNSRIASN